MDVLPLLIGWLVLTASQAAGRAEPVIPPSGVDQSQAGPRPATNEQAEPPEPAPALDPAAATDPAAEAEATDSSVPADPAPMVGLAEEETSLPPSGVDHDLRGRRLRTVLHSRMAELERLTGLRVGVAQTLLFQAATGGEGGRRVAAGGDVDLLLRWSVLGQGTQNIGRLKIAGEYRYQIGSRPPDELGPEIGTLLGTTDGFGEQPFVLKQLYWEQRLDDGRINLRFGRMNPRDLFGGHRFQNSSEFFLNKALSSNPVVAYPQPGLGATLHYRPRPWLSIGGGVADADGSLTSAHFVGFFTERRFMEFFEASVSPFREGLGQGHFRLSLWRKDAERNEKTPKDRGIVISCDQDLGESVTAFARYGYSEGGATAVTHSVTAGVGVRDLLMEGSLTGIGAGWSVPADQTLSDEKVIECFQRVPVTDVADLTLGVQVIFDPSQATDDRVVGVLSVRLRMTF